jgi:hypothetical protein
VTAAGAGKLTGGVRPEDYRPEPMRPLSTPQEIKAATVRGYALAAQQTGQPVDMAAVEQAAVAHLQIVDAYRAGVDVTARATSQERPNLAAAEVAADPDSGVKLRDRGSPDRVAPLHGKGRRDGKWAHARARLRRILEGMTPKFRTTAQGAELDFTGSTSTAQIPQLARRYYRLWGNFMHRHRQSRHNPFAGLSDADACRMFVAEVYAICDASTGRLGQWWVPR